jgi:hypothetical protein
MEACLNHAYPVTHKLKDYGMMRSFITSGTFIWGVELDEGPNGSDMTPSPEKNADMTVYGGCLQSRRRCASSLCPRTPTHCSWGHRGLGV